jgi:hypothetical protein
VDVTVDQQEVDDTDNLNEAEEYEGWKLRELLRIHNSLFCGDIYVHSIHYFRHSFTHIAKQQPKLTT